MKKPYISGIQQMGIGVGNVHEAWKWYRKNLGVDVPIFEEAAEASLMLPYTGGEPRKRHAVLAMNLNGGGGFEIWQYVGRTPQKPSFEILPGDLGINIAKIKSSDVSKTFNKLKNNGVKLLSERLTDPRGKEHFYFSDPYNNIFEVVHSDQWFGQRYRVNGGIVGAVVGVSDIDRSMVFYKEILGYNQVEYDIKDSANDFGEWNSDGFSFRRVLLTREAPYHGPFSEMLGKTEIELIQVKGREPKKIYADRFWGDLGFIHLCFDIVGMNEMRELCASFGSPFTVDSSNSFDMGEAAGHFSYVEDPDGTLIEFVETHKIPIMKKIGWYLDLRKRKPEKKLPKLMLKALSLNRVKD
ncbi:VOC family protein [Membranihabitans maritimus]|uniref:VOC family protein n=1 Tax=Membranihabitans maritimus TaxID=2904244 RepID=UPI001F16F26A|nr:VOC family protein [Membranihabitans maritimus]